MKRFVKSVCLLLVVAILLATPAFATETVEPRSSSYFMRSSVYLYRTSDTTFQVWFDVTAMHSMQELGAKTIKVQRSSDGENWTDMKTYSRDSYSQMIDTNTIAHSDCVSYTGTPGYYYRAYIVLYAKDNSGNGELYRYTASLKL